MCAAICMTISRHRLAIIIIIIQHGVVGRPCGFFCWANIHMRCYELVKNNWLHSDESYRMFICIALTFRNGFIFKYISFHKIKILNFSVSRLFVPCSKGDLTRRFARKTNALATIQTVCFTWCCAVCILPTAEERTLIKNGAVSSRAKAHCFQCARQCWWWSQHADMM